MDYASLNTERRKINFTPRADARFSPRLCRGIEQPVHSDLPDTLRRQGYA